MHCVYMHCKYFIKNSPFVLQNILIRTFTNPFGYSSIAFVKCFTKQPNIDWLYLSCYNHEGVKHYRIDRFIDSSYDDNSSTIYIRSSPLLYTSYQITKLDGNKIYHAMSWNATDIEIQGFIYQLFQMLLNLILILYICSVPASLAIIKQVIIRIRKVWLCPLVINFTNYVFALKGTYTQSSNLSKY